MFLRKKIIFKFCCNEMTKIFLNTLKKKYVVGGFLFCLYYSFSVHTQLCVLHFDELIKFKSSHFWRVINFRGCLLCEFYQSGTFFYILKIVYCWNTSYVSLWGIFCTYIHLYIFVKYRKKSLWYCNIVYKNV